MSSKMTATVMAITTVFTAGAFPEVSGNPFGPFPHPLHRAGAVDVPDSDVFPVGFLDGLQASDLAGVDLHSQRESVSQIGVFHTPRLCNVAPNSIGGPQGRIRRGRTRRESQLADRTAPLSRVKSAWNEATEKLGASCRIGLRGMRAGIGHASLLCRPRPLRSIH